MVYSINDRIYFGKHKECSIREIYKYEPSYLEFAVRYIENFEIDIVEIKKLPKPTPYIRNEELRIGSSILGKYSVFSDSAVKGGIEYIKNGGKLNEVDFEFSNDIIDILIAKRKKLYTPPKWTSIDFYKI